MWRREIIQVCTRDVVAEINADYPGLAIHASRKGYAVTHVRSGLRVVAVRCRADATFAVSKLAPLAQWDAEPFGIDAATRERIRRLCEAFTSS